MNKTSLISTTEPVDVIYLIGYRCTGKSTVGRCLAKKLDRSFLDLDRQFEVRTRSSIQEFWSENGEEAFRELEANLLHETINRDETIVATGGGIVEKAENRTLIKSMGTSIWLKATPETIQKRMTSDSDTDRDRPALRGSSPVDEVSAVLQRRRSLYRNASNHAVQTDNRTPAEVMNAVLDRISSNQT